MKDAGRSLPMWATGFVPQPWNQQLGVADRQPAQLRRPGRRPAAERTHSAGADSRRRGRRQAARAVQPDAGRRRFRSAAASEDLQPAVRRSAGADHRSAAIGRQQRLGREPRSAAPRGSALLASDPHLEVNRLPAIWYEAELHWGENGTSNYVLGATLPGCPLFAVARTRDRRLGRDLPQRGHQRLLHRGLPPGRPRPAGNIAAATSGIDFRVREERIVRKGRGAETHAASTTTTQGTLEADPARQHAGLLSVDCRGSAISRARAGRSRPGSTSCRPQTAAGSDGLSSANARCRRCAGCSPIATGTSACKPNGWFPRRAEAISGLLPIPAWDPANHWRGWLPTSVLPRVYDPPEGFVATANENINPPGGPHAGHAAGARLSQAADRRAARPRCPRPRSKTCRPCNTT